MNQVSQAPLPPVKTSLIKTRIIWVTGLLFLALLIGILRAFGLQSVQHVTLQYEGSRNYVRNVTLDDWRGDILDRRGHLFAGTVHRWAITIDPQKVVEPQRTAEILEEITGVAKSQILHQIDPLQAANSLESESHSSSSALARETVAPFIQTMTGAWDIDESYFTRRLDVLERFFQLQQLRSPKLFSLVNALADLGDETGKLLNADIDKLRFLPRHGRRFAYISRNLDELVIQKLNEAKKAESKRCEKERENGKRCHHALRSVYARSESQRYYPKRGLAAQVIGLVNQEHAGLSGVEAAMNSVLAGKTQQAQAVKDIHGLRSFLHGLPSDLSFIGPSIELSIDEKIQAIAEKELTRSCLASGARAGYAIVARPETGEILAVANYPSYNPNTFQSWYKEQQPLKDEHAALVHQQQDLAWSGSFRMVKDAYADRHLNVLQDLAKGINEEMDAFVEYRHSHPNASRNTAFLDVYEPGSIMKIFTVAAALEEKVVDLDTVFDLERGTWQLEDVDKNVIHDTSRITEGDIGLILKKSSNIGAGKLGFRLGAHRLAEYLRGFGFGERSKSGFPGEAKGLLRDPEKWVPIDLANMSFGQGLAVTGIQLAMALGAIANEGKLMRPILVRRILNEEGQALKTWEPEVVRQVVSPKVARTTLDLMTQVVEEGGTGVRAYIPEWPVAGKTGTGQKPHLRRRGYSEDMWVNTFFGVAPVNEPALSVTVLIDEPQGKRHGGGLIAAPVFRRIMESSLSYLGVKSPYRSAKRHAWLEPEVLAERRQEVAPDESAFQAPQGPKVEMAKGWVPAPDFIGKTMKDASILASKSGIKVLFEGQGFAIKQSVAPQSLLDAEDGLTLTFAPKLPGAYLPPHKDKDNFDILLHEDFNGLGQERGMP